MPAWTALVEKVSKWGQKIPIHEAENLHVFSSVSFETSLGMTDSFTISSVFIAPVLTGRKDSNSQTTSSQPHLWNVCRVFTKLIDAPSVFCMKLHVFIPNKKKDLSWKLPDPYFVLKKQKSLSYSPHPQVCEHRIILNLIPRFFMSPPFTLTGWQSGLPQSADSTTGLSQEPASYWLFHPGHLSNTPALAKHCSSKSQSRLKGQVMQFPFSLIR